MATRISSDERVRHMGLKSPGIITFMLSIVLAVVLLMTKFFGAEIPGMQGNEFWALLTAYCILVLGCVVRGH